MALGQFIKFNASGIEHGTQLDVKIPTNVNNGKQYALKRMQSHNQVPTSASSQAVMNAEKIAKNMGANLKRVTNLMKAKEQQIEHALSMYELNVNHAQKMQSANERFAKIGDKYSQTELQHRENMGVILAGNEGVYQAYTSGSSFDSL